VSYPRRGELYWVALDPTVGTEIAKTRPALIISNDLGNQHAQQVIVAPLTSRRLDRIYPFEVLIPASEGGLLQASKILLNQIRTVDKVRLHGYIGVLPGQRCSRSTARSDSASRCSDRAHRSGRSLSRQT
jgi:mRNA interferase MazF